jgi:hypothetical protein
MLELVSSGLVGMWLTVAGVNSPPLAPAQAATWQSVDRSQWHNSGSGSLSD